MTPSPVAAARLLRTTTRPSLRWRGGGAAGLSEYRPPTSSSPMHAIFSPNDMLVGRAARRRPISGGGGGGGGAVVRRAHSSSSSAAETREGGEEEEGETNDDATTATYDVFIVGGGAVGSALAKRLVERVGGGGSLSIGLLDPRLPPPLSSYDDATAAADGGGAVPMARAYALSPSSLVTLGNDGSGGPGDVVGRLGGIGRVARYDKMQVWESDGPGAIRFSADDLSNHPDPRVSSQGILGAVVEDGPLVSSLWDFLREHGGSVPPERHDGGGSARLDLIAPARVTKIVAPPADGRRVAGGVGGGGGDDELVRLTYETGAPPNGVGDGGTDSGGGGAKTATTERTVRARLLVAADGANSFVRKTLSMPTMGFGYGRKSVICAVRLDDSPGNGMHGTAYQRFFPPGPVALLPLWDGAEGGKSKYANVVWSTTPERAEELTSMPPDAFVQELNDALRVGPTNPPPLTSDEFASGLHPWIRNALYGADMLARSVGEGLAMMSWYDDPFRLPPKASELIGRRFAFDLSLKQATRYVHPRVALVGDAAHTVHPMAGQGLNLGFGDVECLVGCVADAAGGGMDVGGGYFLERYETERRAAVGVVMGGIHVLHGAFGTEVAPAVVMRGIGVNAVNSVGPLRRRLAEVAAGGGGGGVSSNGGRQGHKF